MIAAHKPSPESLRRNHSGRAEWIPLLARIAEGDNDALEQLYDESATHVFSLLMRILADRAQAETALVEVFRRVRAEAHSSQTAWMSPISWLNGLARTVGIAQLRKQSAPPLPPSSPSTRKPPAATAFEPLETHQERRTAAAALDRLTGLQRQIINMTYFQGMTADEVALALEMPACDVRGHICRGLKVLRSIN